MGNAAVIERAMGFAIRRLPTSVGFAAVRKIAASPPRVSISEVERQALLGGSQERLGPSGRLRAWTWGDGPTVALVHGWGGRAAQMAPLAQRLAAVGYRTIAFDVAGHGDSSEREASWDHFIRDIGDIAQHAGQLSGFIGHSAGGLAMMASRELRGIKAERFVCICAPFHPYPAIRAIRQRLNPGERVLERYRNLIAASFQADWKALEAGVAWLGAGAELLLCYDTNDRFVEHADGNRAQALCPGSSLIKFSQYGHVRILQAEKIARNITDFMRSTPEENCVIV